MSDNKLAQLHEILDNPIRRKLLIKMGERDRLSFDDLLKQLKTVTAEELQSQLKILEI